MAANSSRCCPVCAEHLHVMGKEVVRRELKLIPASQSVLHADETTLQVLCEPGKSAQSKSYMWLYRTSGDVKSAIVVYEYQPNRKMEHPKQFLQDFT